MVTYTFILCWHNNDKQAKYQRPSIASRIYWNAISPILYTATNNIIIDGRLRKIRARQVRSYPRGRIIYLRASDVIIILISIMSLPPCAIDM